MAHARKVEGLDCAAEALAGARLILRTRLEEVFDFRDATLEALDDKCVHDMRVATRRLRSALKDFKPILKRDGSGRRLKVFNVEIKCLADALGAVRDLDVQIKSLEKLKENAPQMSDGIEFLIARRNDEREEKRCELKNELADVDEAKLLAMLDLAVGADVMQAQDDGRAEESLRAAAREIIRKNVAEVEKLSDALLRQRASKRLHRLRIAAKRLRYALELFAVCYGDEAEEFAKEIAKLQKSLGDLHDEDVWLDELAELLDGKKEFEMSNAEKEGALWLVHHFTDERTRHYHDALARWHEWQKENFIKRLLELFEIEN